MDIDVKGGLNVKRQYPEALSVFIKPPSIEILRERLIKRGTDDMDTINQRVAKADFELSYASKYDKCIVNNNLDDAVVEITRLIHDFIS